ncbi:hypothetical protein PoB_001225600 [Plakobranchus ocellatus]|uniref:Uncharacterized protein n=1 Tax=Plakobranchus ocellatus TaxID=259542 RepID=A0AAV3YTR6_9GAST|nr:hypothetical protein PoB_001225600 [Plakobranchus ocellatus]
MSPICDDPWPELTPGDVTYIHSDPTEQTHHLPALDQGISISLLLLRTAGISPADLVTCLWRKQTRLSSPQVPSGITSAKLKNKKKKKKYEDDGSEMANTVFPAAGAAIAVEYDDYDDHDDDDDDDDDEDDDEEKELL